MNTMRKILNKLICCIMAVSLLGCIHTSSNVGENDKPVAPDTISDESGQSGDPSLPYMRPWWMD